MGAPWLGGAYVVRPLLAATDRVAACCAAARQQWHVPVFCEKLRRQFQRDWLIDAVALHNLAYFQAHALPAFNAELAHLPESADRECADAVDIGRFVMLCIWRQGLVTWPVLDAFLQSYRVNGVLATGALRYVPTAVRCRRNDAAMTRLNYLEPYCQVYAVTEHTRLQAGLEPLFNLNTQQRRARIQAMLETYLRTLGVAPRRGDILTLMLRAAQQDHMLHSAPVLAAYASAGFETHDLSDAEIRHLAGYAPRTNHRTSPLGTNTVEGVATDVAQLPNAEVASAYDIVHRMAFRQSSRVTEMERQLRAVKAEGPLERLLQAFALWALRREIKKTLQGRLVADEKHRFRHIISVVGYSLLGMSERGGTATHFSWTSKRRL